MKTKNNNDSMRTLQNESDRTRFVETRTGLRPVAVCKRHDRQH